MDVTISNKPRLTLGLVICLSRNSEVRPGGPYSKGQHDNRHFSEEISRILEENTVVNAAVQKLETDISLYKRAYTSMEDECARLKAAKQEVEQQKEDLELKFKVAHWSYFSLYQFSKT